MNNKFTNPIDILKPLKHKDDASQLRVRFKLVVMRDLLNKKNCSKKPKLFDLLKMIDRRNPFYKQIM